ncbi:sensor histidine kinase [Streptomyces sp. NPDC005808]|uniref:sensor histidine kinase n=1 Tax=Streptomyces sp. NPDC005808 TaxID=3364734 RepID=UPI0036CE3A68
MKSARPSWFTEVTLFLLIAVDYAFSMYPCSVAGRLLGDGRSELCGDSISLTNSWTVAALVLALGSLALRRTYPLLGYWATLPSAYLSGMVSATLISLWKIPEREHSRILLVLLAFLGAVAVVIPYVHEGGGILHDDYTQFDVVMRLPYQFVTTAGLVLLRNVQREKEKSLRSEEKNLAKEQKEQYLARISRDVHDDVTAHAALIANRAELIKKLVVGDERKEYAHVEGHAEFIRERSAKITSDVHNILRKEKSSGVSHSADSSALTLEGLLEGSEPGNKIRVHGEIPDPLDGDARQVILRTVQESLTNARKHAPGSVIDVRFKKCRDHFQVAIINGRPSGPPIGFPESGRGLSGLRARAESINARLESGPTPEGGYRVILQVQFGSP